MSSIVYSLCQLDRIPNFFASTYTQAIYNILGASNMLSWRMTCLTRIQSIYLFVLKL
ncbi:hypothetical protein Hanom_Chr15g01400141 [Helianthus anomalus]